jgi:membrane-bound ClpP family serine protease
MGLILFLIILGDILVLAELLLVPGTILTGLLGLGSIVGSCYLAYDNISPTVSIIIFVVNIVVLVVATILLLRAKTWHKLSLETNIESRVDEKPEDKGLQVGLEGISTTRLAPMGKVEFQGTATEVTSEDGVIDPRTAVTISKIQDNKIYVKRANN